ncbi:COQ9 family protein [Oceanibacterium hippocampi]|uniref:COQ9 C-terminal domain-containing protein n=1 Tax=Oceanibacterium hippocampi TaxID=745714 RepID=A0A1Y5SDQ9_9PROT|nr:COQ9 family protein [Oceanibacterium hippocampi]SLN35622.1 hypothetical protein OCH7691_01424 [Oceanibacterium hippocampi]
MAHHLEEERRRILAAALPNVAFDGWTAKTLTAAVEAAGFEPAMAVRAFPGGVREMIGFFIAEADREMVEALEARDLPSMKIRDRIRTAVQVRLEQNAPWREAIRRALAHEMAPQNAPAALRRLHRTVDAMWYAAGDRAADFNYYTKRMLLAGVYSSTLLYWLNDRSEGSAATWRFLDRRIDDVMKIQTVKGRLGGRLDRIGGLVRRPRRPGAVIGAWARRGDA